jgi:polyisoprenoid-binding protein YceI
MAGSRLGNHGRDSQVSSRPEESGRGIRVVETWLQRRTLTRRVRGAEERGEMAETKEATFTRTIEGLEAPAPGDWVLDGAHTNLMFVARYAMLTKVRGHFKGFEGTIHVAEKPEDSWVELTIDASSITTDNDTRDNHLRSGDFLDLENHPTLTFRSTKIELLGDSQLRVTGDLTIRGVTKEVVLDAEYVGTAKDAYGRPRVAFSAKTEIDRDEFGVNWNMALETGGFLVGKRVQVELEVQALPEAVLKAS